MTPSSGLGSFFILRRRGVEQHGRPTVCTMIWTNNPYSKVRHRLPSTETMAGLYFLTTFCPGEPPEKSCYDLLFLTTILTTKYPAKADSTRQYLAVSGSIRQTQIAKNPRNIDFSSTFRGYFLVRGRGFEPPRINHTHLKRARLPVPPPSHMKF